MSSRKLNLSGFTSAAATAAAAAAAAAAASAVTSLEKNDNATTTEKKSIIEIVKTSATDTAKSNAGGDSTTTTTTSKSFVESTKTCVALTLKSLMAKSMEESKRKLKAAHDEETKPREECKKSNGDTRKSTDETTQSSVDSKSTEDTTKSQGDSIKSPGDSTKSTESSTKSTGDSIKSSEGSTKSTEGSTKSSGDSTKSSGDFTKSSEDSSKSSSHSNKTSGDAAKTSGDLSKSAEKTRQDSCDSKKSNEDAAKTTDSTRKSSIEESPSVDEDSTKETLMKEPSGKAPTSSTSMEVKRITRNSPLLLTSPTTANKKELAGELADAAAQNESDDSTSTASTTTSKRTVLIRGRKSIKESAAAKEAAAAALLKEKEDEAEDAKPSSESEKKSEEPDTKAASKEGKTDNEQKVKSLDTSSSSPVAVKEEPAPEQQTTTTRQTRKYVVKEPIPNTRVTRNRQSSTGSSSQTPAAVASAAAKTEASAPTGSTRGRKPGWSKKAAAAAAAVEAAAKRKRSTEDAAAPPSLSGEPGAKYMKIDTSKEDSECGDEDTISTTTDSATIEDVKIKQELIESDESSSATDVSSATNTTATPPTATTTTATTARGRGRWNSRRNQAANRPAFSPSTRSTRQSKVNTSPSPTPPPSGGSGGASEAKRRRTGTPNANTRSSSALSLLKSATAAGASGGSQAVPDEDSKDSMASSMDDLVMADVKLEKLTTPESEETLDFDMVGKSSEATTPTSSQKVEEDEAKSENGISQQLTVDTGVVVAAVKADAEAPMTPVASTSADAALNGGGDSGSEKAASLSPEMVSEGVSEISVKQFYKTPKFRENNLGIEEDPKLGEIVQKVGTSNDSTASNTTTTTTTTMMEVDGADETNAMKDDDCLSNTSIKEGELRLDDSGDEKKSFVEDDATQLSPLVVSDAEGADSEPAVTPLLTDTELPTANCQVDEEDDVTVEESENVSMDNNASVNEDDAADTIEGIEEMGDECAAAIVEVVKSRGRRRSSVKLEEKTKSTECDMLEKAKLKTAESVSNEEEQEEVEEDEEEEATVKVEKMDTREDSNGGADDVLAKINAELQKIGAKLNEKPLKTEKEPNVEESTPKLQEATADAEQKPFEENKENLLGEEVLKDDAESMAVKDDDTKEMELGVDVEEEEGVPDMEEQEEEEEEEDEDDKDMADEKNAFESEKQTPALTHATLSNLNISPFKPKDEDAASVKSNQSNTSWVTLDLEHDEESLRQKEQHLQNLGLLTHKAAEKRRLEYIHQQQQLQQQQQQQQQQHYQTKRKGGSSTSSNAAHEYTGTLKTVIKLNRNSNGSASTSAAAAASAIGGHTRQKAQLHRDTAGNNNGANRRQSLKMTFQKGRGRGQGNTHDRNANDQNAPAEDSYYTIQNENEGGPNYNTNCTTNRTATISPDKSTISTNHVHVVPTHDSAHSDLPEVAHATALHASKKDEKEEILIPEKASSFKFHPGRLCEDQCFYCSGKFGLYDTPCHVGQIKSVERQQKILANEEKLTVDNCLCDACFRHVDRRANVPSYKKRLSAPGNLEHTNSSGSNTELNRKSNDDGRNADDTQTARKCVVPECTDPAAHSLRRKCIRKSVKKFLLNFDIPAGATSVWLCKLHYGAVMQCSGCVLCKRRLGKNHMYHITSDTMHLEKALNGMGIPVQLGIGTAVCKLCRYFANLLMKPVESARSQKAEFVRNYKKRLLQFHNIHEGSNDASEADDEDTNGPSTSQKSKALKKGGANKQDGSCAKEMPSPTGSSGSSVECLGLADASNSTVDQQEQHQRRRRRQQQQEQQQQENDTDYDVPMMSSDSNSSISPPLTEAGDHDVPTMSKLKAILQSNSKSNTAGDSSADISNALRANPNISMRELFPGEEDLGLNFRAPFGSNASQRTPEGWTRVQTFLQYDEPTRRLWEELQKPYGNQSSFLRHLILLEKYYRNGDLILSPNASSNASVYTQTVRQRLASYDQGHCGGLQTDGGVSVSKDSPTSANNKAAIPTVEIHEDDDEEMEDASGNRNQLDDEGNSMDVDSRVGAAASLTAETTITRSISKELRTRSVSVDKLTKQLNSSAVTIKAIPKETSTGGGGGSAKQSNTNNNTAQQQQQSLHKEKEGTHFGGGGLLGSSASCPNSRSILKTNLLGMNKSVEILPVSTCGGSRNTSPSAHASGPSNESKQQKIIDVANKLLGSQLEAASSSASSSSSSSSSTQNYKNAALLTSPPELVSFQRRSTGNMPTPLAGNATGSATTSAASALNLQNANKARPAIATKMATGRNSTGGAGGNTRPPPNVVILADTLTPQERQQSKSWRPTLMPVEENQHLLTKGGPLYQTVDKRRLPAVVQVQSGGKPFLISIFDYNRMCILRREKLLRDQMLKSSGKNKNDNSNKQQQQHGQQQHGQQQQQQQEHHHHQQQQQQQKSSVPLNLAAGSNFNKSALTSKQQQQQAAQRQLFQLQMMQLQKQHMQQQAQLKSGGGGGNNNNSSAGGGGPLRYQPIAPKPPQQQQQSNATSGSTSSSNAFGTPPMMPLLANAITNAAVNSNQAAAAAIMNNASSWLWNNFPDANQMILNGAAAAAAAAAQSGQSPKLPQLLHKSGATTKQQQQQLLLDNTLMSKIPKSLTVIPQHKLMNNAASNGGGGGGGGSGAAGHKE